MTNGFASQSADLVSVWKQLNHVYDGAPLGGVGFEQRQSFRTSGRQKELQDDKDVRVGMRRLGPPRLENVAQAHALVAVDHGVDHVLPSVLQGLVEERRVALVQDERGSSAQQELDGGHVALSRCEVERGALEYWCGKYALISLSLISMHINVYKRNLKMDWKKNCKLQNYLNTPSFLLV